MPDQPLPQSSQANSFLASLFAPVGQQITQSLPTRQEAAVAYVEAVIVFWVIGGIALYLVNRISK